MKPTKAAVTVDAVWRLPNRKVVVTASDLREGSPQVSVSWHCNAGDAPRVGELIHVSIDNHLQNALGES